jgi:hypothetical protein
VTIQENVNNNLDCILKYIYLFLIYSCMNRYRRATPYFGLILKYRSDLGAIFLITTKCKYER